MEKERATRYREYEGKLHALEVFIDEFDEKLNFTFVEYVINWYSAQRNMIGLEYATVADISTYLVQLQNWCKEVNFKRLALSNTWQEGRVCEEHKQERDATRKILHEQQTQAARKHFAEVFNNIDIINLTLSIIDDQELANPNVAMV